ncbi:hypothetical protein, partial [Streptomyces eurythermus]|uniref:hypothetical protein n=1 Tax=Streptomyces eurythermus TaxID=42237 RepID=UPI0034018F92
SASAWVGCSSSVMALTTGIRCCPAQSASSPVTEGAEEAEAAAPAKKTARKAAAKKAPAKKAAAKKATTKKTAAAKKTAAKKTTAKKATKTAKTAAAKSTAKSVPSAPAGDD